MSESTVKAQQCLRAFADGNYDESLSLIDQVEEPHKLKDDKYGATLLHLAATRGWLNIVQQLLDKYEFHPTCRRNDGATPLLLACESGHLSVIRYLITECKCDPMCKMNDGATPVHAACYNGHLNVIWYLITECKCDPMCKMNDGATLVHAACYNGHLNVVRYLITECKCDPMCKMNHGATPLHSASFTGHLDVVRYLITECKCDPMCKRDDGSTPLDSACYNGHLNVIQYLITECKCDPMCKTDDGSTPLDSASYNGHLNIVRYLISECKCDPMCKKHNGVTPLRSACYNGHLNVVRYLISECKCDPMCKRHNGATPLHAACLNGHLNVVRYLISECKCDPMCKKHNGVTPLHSACYNRHLHVVRYLITECKCDPMCKKHNGATPLHAACLNGHLNVVRYLISECKCDPMCKTHNGATPLHSACYKGHLDVVRYLISECKCDPMCKDRFGSTPLRLACDNCHLPVIEYLLSTGRVDPESKVVFLIKKPSFLADHKVLKVLAKFSKLKTCFSVDSYVNVVLLGNPGAGKSTLAQVIIQTSSGRHLLGRFQKIEGVELHTAGIVPTRIEHQRLGNIILHDLAGQSEYYSSHIAVLENLLQDYPAVFINFVNLCEEEALTSLHKWITVIENVSQNVSSPCHVVTVASHVDMITHSEFSDNKKDILEILSSRLDSSNVINDGLMGLDCRKLGGGDVSPFMNTLSKCCQTIRSAKIIYTNMYCRMLYTFLENEGEIVHRVNQLCQLMAARKISENYYVPQEQDDVLETLSSLHATGLITFLKNNHTPGNSWVIVDKRVLLAKVNGVLFAPETFKQYHDISSNTGIITQSALTHIFNDLDPEMIIHFLYYMKLSMEITSDMLIYSNLQRTLPGNSTEVKEKLLFIPALVRNVQRPHEISGTIQFGWCLQCSNPHHFFFPRFLHVLLLHLAYQYALPKTADNPHHRRCTIWTNGILWSDVYGVQTLVEIVDNSQCVLLLMSCLEGLEHNMITLRREVIKDILSHQKDTCPRLELQEFIIDPSQLRYPIDKPSSLTLYNIEHIASCVVHKLPVVTPYMNEGKLGIKISDLFPCERINPDTLSVFAGRNPETLTTEYDPVKYRRSKRDYPEDLDITDLEEVQESVKEIVDWMGLGLKLGLFYSTLQKIETDVRTVNKCKREMLAAWLKGEDKSKNRTWSTLVDAVHKMNHHSLAEEITEQHLK